MHLIFNAISSFFVASGAAVANWAVIDFNSILLLIAHEEREGERKWGRKWETAKKNLNDYSIVFHFISFPISFFSSLSTLCVCECVCSCCCPSDMQWYFRTPRWWLLLPQTADVQNICEIFCCWLGAQQWDKTLLFNYVLARMRFNCNRDRDENETSISMAQEKCMELCKDAANYLSLQQYLPTFEVFSILIQAERGLL